MIHVITLTAYNRKIAYLKKNQYLSWVRRGDYGKHKKSKNKD